MRIPYADLISESVPDLLRAERTHRGTSLAPRVQMLRLFKEGTATSQVAVAAHLGYSERQIRRWWTTYHARGIGALLQRPRPSGLSERITPEAWAGLKERMRAGEIAQLEDARQYLRAAHGISYAGISSISALFRRHKVKLKTGRPRHENTASDAERAAFKK